MTENVSATAPSTPVVSPQATTPPSHHASNPGLGQRITLRLGTLLTLFTAMSVLAGFAGGAVARTGSGDHEVSPSAAPSVAPVVAGPGGKPCTTNYGIVNGEQTEISIKAEEGRESGFVEIQDLNARPVSRLEKIEVDGAAREITMAHAGYARPESLVVRVTPDGKGLDWTSGVGYAVEPKPDGSLSIAGLGGQHAVSIKNGLVKVHLVEKGDTRAAQPGEIDISFPTQGDAHTPVTIDYIGESGEVRTLRNNCAA